MSFPSQARITGFILVLAIPGICGCSGRPSTAYIEGKVTHDGQPIEGATVVFMPEGGTGNPASGVTDVEGVYALTTWEVGDGAVRGEYRVVILKNEARAVQPPPIESGDEKSITEHYKAIMVNKKRKPLLPKIYSTYKDTPLRYSVSGSDKKADFQLQGK